MIWRGLKLQRLIVGTVAALSLVGATSLLAFLLITRSAQERVQEQAAKSLNDQAVAERIEQQIGWQLGLAQSYDAVSSPVLLARYDSLGARIREDLRFYLFRELSADERRLVEQIRSRHARVEQAARRVFLGEAYAVPPGLVAAITHDLRELIERREIWQARAGAAQARLDRTLWLSALAISALFIALTAFLMLLLRDRLLARLKRLANAAERVGSGDFTALERDRYDDELTHVGDAFNDMVGELRQAHSELQESEGRYHSLFEGVPIGLYRSTPDGHFLEVNETCVQLFGAASREELLARPVPLEPSLREQWKHELAERIGGQQNYWPVDRPDGTTIWVRDTAHAVRDAYGRVLHYEGALEDVTDAVVAQRALERNEARFRSLIEKGSDGIIVIDRDGVLQYASPSVERLLGYPPEQVVGQPVLSFVHVEDAERVAAELGQLMGPRQGSDFVEFRCRHRDGGWRILHVVGNNLLLDPNVNGVVVNIVDLTEQRRLERQVLQSQKMEAVGRLAGGIAHDFNNLLTAIGGYADLLEYRYAATESIEIVEIRRAVERAAALTRQLLAFSRQQVVQPKPVDLSAVATGMQDMLARLIGDHIELHTECEPGMWVHADVSQMEQVLLNLVVNARDAMPNGGVVGVAVGEHQVMEDLGSLAPGAYVALSVRDAGCGMTPEVLSRAFEPFFTTKELGKGTGLGLATVYGIVSQAGGAVLAESEPGVGSVLRVYLPRIAPPEPAVRREPTPLAESGGCVLLVEDEAAVRSLAGRVLRRQGFRVLEASHGAAALALLARPESAVDLMVTDVVMPEMGGAELAEHVVRRWPDLPVLFISGYAQDSLAERAPNVRPLNFLEKPFTPDELVRRVREILDCVPARAP